MEHIDEHAMLTPDALEKVEDMAYGDTDVVPTRAPMTLDDLKRLTKAKAAQGLSKKEMKALEGQTLPLYEVMVHPVDIVNDDTGEIVHARRVVLGIGEDRYLAFVSREAETFADLLLAYNPSGVFHGAVEFRFASVETRRGRRTYSFQVV